MPHDQQFTNSKIIVMQRLTALAQKVLAMPPKPNQRSVKNIERDMEHLHMELKLLKHG